MLAKTKKDLDKEELYKKLMPTLGMLENSIQNNSFQMPAINNAPKPTTTKIGGNVVVEKFKEEEFTDEYIPDMDWVNEVFMEEKKNPEKKESRPGIVRPTAPPPQQAQVPLQAAAPARPAVPSARSFQAVNTPAEASNAYLEKIKQRVRNTTMNNGVNQNIKGGMPEIQRKQPAVGLSAPSVGLSSPAAPQNVAYSTSPVQNNLSATEGSQSNLVVHNAMEDLVVLTINRLVPNFNCCMCEKCMNDMAAITLNSLPTKYIVSTKDRIEELTQKFLANPGIDIEAEAIKAIMEVKAKPRH